MKLIIQIPCYNEAETLAIALRELPKNISGIDTIEYLIIDDGSVDDTVAEAGKCGVHHIVRHTHNMGLAKAFMTGLNACIELGADIIVNTDADNQYCAEDIEKIVAPILRKEADMVIGVRPIGTIEHFSFLKKQLQRLGSWMVRKVSGTDVADAPSGFRAISRNGALQLNVFTRYTYTLETIIQAGHKNLKVLSVPIRVNEDLRPSRLVSSIPSYVRKSIFTMLRVFVIYRPFAFLCTIACVVFGAGFLIGLRFLYLYMTGSGSGHVQSLILASILLLSGFQTFLIAFIADLISVNRKLLEELQYNQRKNKLTAGDKG